MRLTKINKNQMLDAFLANIALGYPTTKAARKAGFTTPERDIAGEMLNPDFIPRVSLAIRHRVATTLAPQAMALAESMLNDNEVSDRIRWDIAKTFLQAGAGVIAPKPSELEPPAKDISQMTGSDIMQLRQSLEAEITNRANGAKLIEHQPQPLDFLD